MADKEPALFKYYPELKKSVSHLSLADFPTPVEKLDEIGNELGFKNLYIKRDDLCSSLYGSNKVRKLEFFLGDALAKKCQEVITIGYAGSNHSLATSIYANLNNLKSISILMPQVNAHYVRRNLLASHYYKGQLFYYDNYLSVGVGLLNQIAASFLKYRNFPKYIPGGGSSPEGVLAYVSAALELNDQISRKELPKPDVIYVTLASSGTFLGIMLGLKLLNLDIEVIGVRVIENYLTPQRKMVKLFNDTSALLNKKSKKIPLVKISEKDLHIREEYMGSGYARFTKKGVNATRLMHQKKGLKLNGTYTGKAFAAVLDDIKKPENKDKNILFWNTYNSCDLSDATSQVDYRMLPENLHKYFENDVQDMDPGIDR